MRSPLRVLLALAVGVGCGGQGADPGEAARPETPPLVVPGAWFREIGERAGLLHRRSTTEYGSAPQRFAGGVCLLDVNADGRLDLFFPGEQGDRKAGPHLYVASDVLRWEDETVARGLSDVGKGGGCLAFDLEGDGDLDLLVTGQDTLRLFRNDAGRFVDVSTRLGSPLPVGTFATSAVAFDADGDGDLDLAVGSFGRYLPPPADVVCAEACDAQITRYQPTGTMLLLQRDDGSFVDQPGRVFHADDPTLVLLATDLDDDGRIDLFVGNDLAARRDRYLRRTDAGWEDIAEALGVAYVARSKSGISSMSAFDADFDGDGQLDLAQSSNDVEPDALFRCSKGASGVSCADIGESLELFRTPDTFRWGQALIDLDHDGVLELVEGAGHWNLGTGGLSPTHPTLDRPLLWRRDRLGAPLALVEGELGFDEKTAARGLIAADLDDDGDLDVIVATALGRPLLLQNVREKRGGAMQLRLVARGKNPFAVGAKVRVHVGSRVVPFIVHAGIGYASSGDPRLHVGVGAESIVRVDVDWPSGARTVGLELPAHGTQLVHEP